MAENTGMAGKVALLLWAQTLGLAGAQTTQLVVESPWRPAVLWDRVTLTCQGSGTASATTWYKDRERWVQDGQENITVTKKDTYWCALGQALLEGDTVTLCCQGWWNNMVTSVSFYQKETDLEVFSNSTELSLSPLQLNHSGHYSCKGQVEYWVWKESALVTVTVHVPVANATIIPSPLSHQVRAGFLRGVIALGSHSHPSPLSSATARKQQERVPPDPPAPPEEGEVLYTHAMVTKRAGASPRATTLQDPQVTYAELRGPQGRPREPSDIYGNVL
ncbi:low affinity immunoglobulin gamma Fc region receptor II-like [Ammospiza nelsoni]|uniref:low affinity immunoglobulin gamma Fc region receptor II-like n=1 Tax=Ammospiza nelsoni TaxID=2857394 RepID=UPI00286BB404|nr:low affinity immunoglobulin gamma Fc region receptor II-like [Ammospiza nelsoni]